MDFAATFAEIIGHDLSNDVAIDSYNILPILKGEKVSSPLRVATVQNTNKGKYALRQGDWVFINTHTGASRSAPKAYLEHFGLKTFPENAPGLLFNLKDDPRQSNNLYEQFPEKAADMRAILERYVGGERCAPKKNNSNKVKNK